MIMEKYKEIFIEAEVWSDLFNSMIDGVDDLVSAEIAMLHHMVKEFSDGEQCMFILEPLDENKSTSKANWLKELAEDEPEFWLGDKEMNERYPYLFPSEKPHELWGDEVLDQLPSKFENQVVIGRLHGNPIVMYKNVSDGPFAFKPWMQKHIDDRKTKSTWRHHLSGF